MITIATVLSVKLQKYHDHHNHHHHRITSSHSHLVLNLQSYKDETKNWQSWFQNTESGVEWSEHEDLCKTHYNYYSKELLYYDHDDGLLLFPLFVTQFSSFSFWNRSLAGGAQWCDARTAADLMLFSYNLPIPLPPHNIYNNVTFKDWIGYMNWIAHNWILTITNFCAANPMKSHIYNSV